MSVLKRVGELHFSTFSEKKYVYVTLFIDNAPEFVHLR